MKKTFFYPAWHDDVRAIAGEGATPLQLAEALSVSKSKVYFITAKNWRSYLLKSSSGFYEAAIPDLDKEVDKFSFVPSKEMRRAPKADLATFYDFVEHFRKSKPMAENLRQFEQAPPKDIDGRLLRGHRIKCSKCDKTESYYAIGGSDSPRFAEKQFLRLGWAVGAGPRADLCPEHFRGIKTKPVDNLSPTAVGTLGEKILEAMPQPKEEPQPEINGHDTHAVISPVKLDEPIPLPAPQAIVETKPDDQMIMGKTEKRIIFSKLNDIYGDEKTGYTGDWTDHKVAEDLGVPDDWVMLVREEHFGPAFNAQMKAAELEALFKRATDMVATLDRQAALVRASFETIKSIDQKVDEALKAQEKASDRVDELLASLVKQDEKAKEFVSVFNASMQELKNIREEITAKSSRE
jgi:hypothetical protein